MDRPKCLEAKSFGGWFCYVSNIHDQDLMQLNVVNAKKHILNAGYLNTPGLRNKIESFHLFLINDE